MKQRIRQWVRLLAWSVIDIYLDANDDRQHARRLLATRQPSEDEVDRAVRMACAQVGLRSDAVALDDVIGPKALEVLALAAHDLGVPMRTPKDLAALLR